MKRPVTFYISCEGTGFADPRKNYYREDRSIIDWLWERKNPVKIIAYKSKGNHKITNEFYEFNNIKDCWEWNKPS